MAAPLQLTRLRSQLQHISSEFDNLTLAELKESKIGLQQRVFIEIAKYSPLLRGTDLCSRCSDLIDRSRRLTRLVDRERREEQGRETKLRFMTLVQEALVMLSWPPACEPFADVLTPLMNDRELFLTAIEFMLSTVLPSSGWGRSEIRDDKPVPKEEKPYSKDYKPFSKDEQRVSLKEKKGVPRKISSSIASPRLHSDSTSLDPSRGANVDHSEDHRASTEKLSEEAYHTLKTSFLVSLSYKFGFPSNLR